MIINSAQSCHSHEESHKKLDNLCHGTRMTRICFAKTRIYTDFFVCHPERSPEKKHENIYIKKPDNAVNSVVRQQIEKPKSILIIKQNKRCFPLF